MSSETYADREIRLACERERQSAKDDKDESGAEYGIMCYESAKKAYDSLLEDDHSNNSIRLTINILNRLVNNQPLTPIEDAPDSWNLAYTSSDYDVYQNSRMSSLFKDIHKDGYVYFHDNYRILIVDMQNPDWYSANRFVTSIAEEVIGPITMPYFPMTQPIKVTIETFLAKETGGDYDTMAVENIIIPTGFVLSVDRYFQFDSKDPIEITHDEFRSRKDLADRLSVSRWNDTKN